VSRFEPTFLERDQYWVLASLNEAAFSNIDRAYFGEKDYQQLLKQATSMMIALRDIAGTIWRADDILCDVAMHDRDPLDAISQARQTIMDGLEGYDSLLKPDALEKLMECGHERRFTIHQERSPSLCAMCELKKANKEAQ
jgi:hypothetical protein